MNLERYNNLPDGMQPEEVCNQIEELLAVAEANGDLDPIQVSEAFYQLADRQWHTYTHLSSANKRRTEKWISDNWVQDSLEFVVNVGFIAGSIGLPGVIPLLDAESRREQIQPELQKEVLRVLEEIAPNTHDPYRSLR